MRYYSDLLKKFYDEKDKALLEKEEAAFKDAQKKQDAIKKAESADKKVLANKISDTESVLKKAFEDEASAKLKAREILEKSQEEAAEIISKGNEDAQAILDAARSKVKAAQKNRCDAISAYNDKYGAYTKTVTGDEAKEEYEHYAEMFDDLFTQCFKNLFR